MLLFYNVLRITLTSVAYFSKVCYQNDVQNEPFIIRKTEFMGHAHNANMEDDLRFPGDTTTQCLHQNPQYKSQEIVV